MSEISQLLTEVANGNMTASDELLPLIYDELRKLATAKMAKERPGDTLQATALVHEAYLRLTDGDADKQWSSRAHFFAAAAESMRRILVDRARHKNTVKRGGQIPHEALVAVNCPASNETPDRLVAIDEALENLEQSLPDAAMVLKLRYFTGMKLTEAAEILEISAATAKRRWALARAFLFDQLGLSTNGPSGRVL